MTARSAMDKLTYLNFYRESVTRYSKKAQRKIYKTLLEKGKITFDPQMRIPLEGPLPIYVEKNDVEAIIAKTSMDTNFMGFYESWEFIKLYKYSVPFFYVSEKSIDTLLKEAHIKVFDEDDFHPDYMLSIHTLKP